MVGASDEMEFVLFADDTNIFVEARNVEELFRKVNKGLDRLNRWFRCNKLTLNLKKTEYVFSQVAGAQRPLQEQIQMGGVQIKQVEGARFLGVWVDKDLRWTTQIEKVRTKVGQLLGVVGRASSVLDGRSLLWLYNGLVLPHLQYCLMVWGDFNGGRNKTLGMALYKYQKRFVGLIAGLKGRYHSDPLLARYGLLKIEDLYKHQLRIHAWRFWHGHLPTAQ